MLYATFLQVPFTRLIAAFRDVRFLTAVLAINFVVVPVVVAALTLPLTLSRAVLLGVLLTLLTPCIDYVIVFCGLAGGDHRRLLAAAPVLMLTQMVALPLLLWLFVGPELADIVDLGPFLEAFGVLIVVPLLLAWGTQTLAARHRSGRLGRRRASSSRNYAARRTRRSASAAMSAAMVPLMTATLFVVVAGQFVYVRLIPRLLPAPS